MGVVRESNFPTFRATFMHRWAWIVVFVLQAIITGSFGISAAQTKARSKVCTVISRACFNNYFIATIYQNHLHYLISLFIFAEL